MVVYVSRLLDLCLCIFSIVLTFVMFNNNPKLMSPINIDYQRLLGIIYMVSENNGFA